MSATAHSTDSNRRLYRSSNDRMIAGVCGGLGEFFGVDPTVIRLLVFASVLLPGPQVLAYIAAWIIVPQRSQAPHPRA